MADLVKEFPIHEFIDTEWASYADYDNRRSLPHIMDGLKTTQRKAIYTATTLAKNEKPRVSQLASRASERCNYHHGEASMLGTIVKLAQDHPGTNNIPWLDKQGQFGNRLDSTAAAGRYIHSWLHSNFHTFFRKEDQDVVNYLYDDGDKIEPEYFIPVIPTLLVNGAEGMGNGFSVDILTYNPVDVAKACREVLKHGKVKTPLVPWIKGWNGAISKENRQVTLTGCLKIVHSTKVEITELPPKYNNEKFKAILNKLLDDKIIKDYKNASNEEGWHWTIECPRELTAKGVDELIKLFKLTEKVTENFVFWDSTGKAPVSVDSAESLVEYWYKERIPLYQKSIDYQIKSIKDDIFDASLKMNFIEWCLKTDFKKFTKSEFIENAVKHVKDLDVEHATQFVGIAMYKITKDEVQKLAEEIDSLLDALDVLEELTPEILMEQNLKIIKSA